MKEKNQTSVERSGRDMPLEEAQIRRLRAIAAGISAIIEQERVDGHSDLDKADLDKIAGLYDCALQVLEHGDVPEARAAFEVGYMMGKRNRSPELAANVAARIWPNGEHDDPEESLVERIANKLHAMLGAVPNEKDE